MAENKKSFILYCDLIHTISQMPKDKAGELFLHILQYVNDKNPTSEDLIINLTFEPIKQQLKRDLAKWDKFVEKQRLNGALGGRPAKKEEPKVNPNNPSVILVNPIEPKKADNVTVTVSDNVTDSVIVKKKKKEVSPEVQKLRGECREYFKQHYHCMKGTEYYWVAKDATALISLLSQIKIKIKEKTQSEEVSNEDLLLGFQVVISNITDVWILNNYSITNISSKFNEIYSKIKNGNTTKNTSKYHN
jgi:hypothetical protein